MIDTSIQNDVLRDADCSASRIPFYLFLGISLLIHAFLVWQYASTEKITTVNQSGILKVALTKTTARAAVTENKTSSIEKQTASQPSTTHKNTAKPAARENITVAKTKPAKNSQEIASQTRKTDLAEVQTTTPGKTPQDYTQLVSNEINQSLARFFYYPRLAIHRNWQGTVLLAIEIDEDGLLRNISIQESSGHRVLDNAATNAANRIQQININKANFGSTLKIVLPVIYQLEAA